ncbi:MAG: hypothetical protein HY814_00625 [Candidatus Riflebacteria bacterium]|nr:hypothetical protein [Candidatus Riflebacteria bacterium]
MPPGCCEAAGARRCPDCGAQGHRVDAETVRALTVERVLAAMPQGELGICLSPSCDTVYFSQQLDSPWVARREDVTVRVFRKEQAPGRLVCYCFGHTVASIREEVLRTRNSGIEEELRRMVADRRCSCKTTNPQGTCCLGDVRRVVEEVKR